MLMFPCVRTDCDDYEECMHSKYHEFNEDCYSEEIINEEAVLCYRCIPAKEMIKEEEFKV